MNVFYTGLGIVRSLGQRGIRIIGLSAHRGIYGNFTRFASIRRSPDSRENPDDLLRFLLALEREAPAGSVIFPTRDDDVVFLDRHRERLSQHFHLALPSSEPLRAALDKWETARCAEAAGVTGPRSCVVTDTESLMTVADVVDYPCVLKPISAHHWRKATNWETVGRRKAIAIDSKAELIEQYRVVSPVEPRALIQEIVPGADDRLWVAACYFDRNSKFVAGFTAQKLFQVPEGFGTGCIVQSFSNPEVLEMARRLLEQMRYVGIAEVEFKKDSRSDVYKLIEINPRPWDQHRLGFACGVDLIYCAWCELTGIPLPTFPAQSVGQKWIAEDVFFLLLLRSLLKWDGKFFRLLRMARGQRTYGIWSDTDPLPLFGFVALKFLPDLLSAAPKYVLSLFRKVERTKTPATV
jgi:predicted ATP-grasp superfamily ATP-dependent carboligase